MSKPILYGMAVSHNTRKVLAVARHLGVDIAFRPVDLIAKETFKPDFLALNPNGLAPVLVDDGLSLWESNAIIVHLAQTAFDRSLWPDAPAVRSDLLRWLFWHSSHWDPGFETIAVERMVKSLEGTGPPDPIEVARGERLITRFGAVLDQHLAARRFVAGEKVGLADFALGSSLQYQHLVALPIGEFRNIDRWYHGLFDLRAWSETEPDWEALGLPGSPFMRRAA